MGRSRASINCRMTICELPLVRLLGADGGTLSTLIPPPLLHCTLLTEHPVDALFIAGMIQGLLGLVRIEHSAL
jgi:hypothetical protein